tara:strand:- start:2304 stop:3233 length:930 start_codon:yes stop_codon:yes gene_type:complete
MTNEIEQIASKVLGKTTDGKTMMRYETPDDVDASLLVGIPRVLNRTDYDIGEDDFCGMDTWNAYEFSCLLNNGFPISGWLRWSYPSNSECIVESKSAKLYLNSYNMAKMGASIMEAIDNCEKQIEKDFREVLKLKDEYDIFAKIELNDTWGLANPMAGSYLQLEDIVDVEGLSELTDYAEDPNILEVISQYDIANKYTSRSLRSNCRVTNQPDWGDIYIHIKGDKTVTPESLIRYIVSMRSENHFHEEICEAVYKRLSDLLDPSELVVACLYTRRGGIDINPIRASSEDLLGEHPIAYGEHFTAKTMRQ